MLISVYIPCSYDNLDVKATQFFKTCEDPGPLNELLFFPAKMKIRQKQFAILVSMRK